MRWAPGIEPYWRIWAGADSTATFSPTSESSCLSRIELSYSGFAEQHPPLSTLSSLEVQKVDEQERLDSWKANPDVVVSHGTPCARLVGDAAPPVSFHLNVAKDRF